MISRRDFLAGSTALYIGSHCAQAFAEDSRIVNDIHSQLNRTRVDGIVSPTSVNEIQAAVREAKAAKQALSIAGGRHAMGGQQFGTGTVLLDMRQMNQVLNCDVERGVLELSDESWRTILYLAHENKSEAFHRYADYYLSADGQLYWSDTHQLSFYPENYHRLIDEKLHAKRRQPRSLPKSTYPAKASAAF
jgi:hypothetical protein